MHVGNVRGCPQDTLYFRVSVKVANHKPWLVCTDKINIDSTRTIKDNKTLESIIFKVSNFNTWQKSTDSTFYSDSFYTSPGDYKMCITVFASGRGSGKGQFVSVYAMLLDGPCGNDLPPAFTGAVTFHLLNQLDDQNHYTKSLECSNLRVGKMKGYSQFISHSQLSLDVVKKTQYLKNDAFYFRATVKAKKHMSWLDCTYHT